MSGFLSIGIIQTALELGLIYSLVALSLFISFSILNICDLSTDGCYTLGCAVGAMVTISGHPVLAVFLGMAAGMLSGFVTAFLQTKLGVESILAGIIVNTGLYTVNLAVMGFSSNVSIFGSDTIFDMFASLSESRVWKQWSNLILLALILFFVCIGIHLFLGTRLGLSIRATGDSPAMVRASSINPAVMIVCGLVFSNALTGMAGALVGQINGTSDINLGTGMVTIALASLVIGDVFFRKGSMLLRIIGVVIGSILYRLIMSMALRLNIPTEAFKLVSAAIVALALTIPRIRQLVALKLRKHRQLQQSMGSAAGIMGKGGSADA